MGAWDDIEKEATDIWGSTPAVETGNALKSAEEASSKGIDWYEDSAKKGSEQQAKQWAGTPGLEQLGQANAWMTTASTQFTGGVARGVMGLVGALGHSISHPLDTGVGLLRMAEHIPAVGTPLKAAHIGWDMAVNGETAKGAEERTHDDGKFWWDVGKGFINPMVEQGKKGRYGDAAGQAAFQAALFATGLGEVGAAGEGANATKLAAAADTADVAAATKGAALEESAATARAAAEADAGGNAARAGAEADSAAAEAQGPQRRLSQKNAPADAVEPGEGRNPEGSVRNKGGKHGLRRGAQAKRANDSIIDRLQRDLGFSDDERAAFHRDIGGQNFDPAQLLEEAEGLFGKKVRVEPAPEAPIELDPYDPDFDPNEIPAPVRRGRRARW